jgi:hypothetical protein
MLHRKIWKKLHRHHDIFISWHHHDQVKLKTACQCSTAGNANLERNGETSNENSKATSISYLVIPDRAQPAFPKNHCMPMLNCRECENLQSERRNFQ